jgi:hypothetical protein
MSGQQGVDGSFNYKRLRCLHSLDRAKLRIGGCEGRVCKCMVM